MILHAQPQLRQPQEDAAINNLLDIDLRQQEDLNIWGDRKIMVKGHNRTYSYKKRPPYSGKVDSRREGLKSAGANFETDKKGNDKGEMMSHSMQLNEREFWCSRVNWMEQTQQKVHRTFKPKLNKKYYFSYEANGRKNSKTRYEELEKMKRDEYKVNMIYSLLNHQDVKGQAKEKERTRSHSNIKVANSNKSLLKKQDISTPEVSKKMEDYMRATLMKYYDKQEHDFHKSQRNPQQERGTIIRQMLINLQNIKNQEKPQQPASNDKGKSFTRLTVRKSLRKMQ